MKDYPGFIRMTAEDIGCDPRIPKGAQLLCSETLKPQDGDYILIRRGSAPPLIRAYFLREDGSVLLKSFHKDADSYVTTPQGLESAGYLVIVRMEYDFPASERVAFPAEKEKSLSPCAVPFPAESGSPSVADDFLTFEEAMDLLKVKRTRMYAMLRSGELRASKLGKLWRVERRSIQEYFASKTYNGAKK
jgi:DNA binding domain, excisionase family